MIFDSHAHYDAEAFDKDREELLGGLADAGVGTVVNVGASLEVMERDSKKMRGDRPFIFTNIRGNEHVDEVIRWIKENVLLEGM